MKKLLINLVILSLYLSANGQQLDHWYIAPMEIEMISTSPTPLLISPTIGTNVPGTVLKAGNGYYNSAGDLLFYIADGNIYDYNNTIMSPIRGGGTEIIVLPFETNNNCQSKYSVFITTGGFTSASSLWQYIVDMKSMTVTEVYVDQISYNGSPSTEYGAIALSKPNPASSNDRYLYFLAGPGTIGAANGGQINKIIIHNNGTFTLAGKIYPTILNPNSNAGAEIFAQELDISPDGRRLAWGSFAAAPSQLRYHMIELNSTGDYVNNSYVQFNNPGISGNNVSGFRGIEFYGTGSNTKLFVGEGTSGIHSINIPLVNTPPLATDFKFVSNSVGYGNSQIEYARNSLMYASSSQPLTIGAFNPSVPNPTIINSSSFGFPNPPGANWQSTNFYTLPDQIDGQNYSSMLQTPITPVLTVGSYIHSTSGTTTWSTGTGNPWSTSQPVKVLQNIIVDGNSTLIISGMTFQFSRTAKVIIKPGSHLKLINTTFTSFPNTECNETYTWKGIDVWGNSLTSQTNASAHGKLTVTTNSVIEYAEIGARNYNSLIGSFTSGGMIYTSGGAIFKDNNTAIELKPFSNFPSQNYKASFSATDFTITDEYPFSTDPKHISIDKCRGIGIGSCDFDISSTDPTIIALKSYGIKSIDGYFLVNSNSTFSNLWHGIDAKRVLSTLPFSVNNSIFNNNQVGILANGVNNIIMRRCTLNIGGNLNPTATNQIGLSMQTCSGYVIEENVFQLSTNLSISQGITINNSGPANNQIYKNTFTNLSYGNIASSINRDNSFAALHGLQYLCNQNSQNDLVDIYISKQVGTTPHGVRAYQGNSTKPAGNTFSHTITGTSSDIFNKASPLTYYYRNFITAQQPVYYNFPSVVISPVNVNNTCPSNICCDETAQIPLEILESMETEYSYSELSFLNLLYIYNSLMDGGSTNALLTEIQQTWPNEANNLRIELLELSPYLSSDAIKEVAERNILPHAILLEICLSNPEATRNEELLNYLEYEMPNPLPTYMIDVIKASWDQETSRTVMENTLGEFSSNMSSLSDRIIANIHYGFGPDSISNDTTNFRSQLIFWLNRIQTLTAKYDLVELYLSEIDFEACESILDSLPENFNFSDDQEAAYIDYLYFYQFRKNLYDSGRDISQLETFEIDALVVFSEDPTTFAKVLARNTLCCYYELCMDENYEIDLNGDRMMALGNSPSEGSSKYNVKAAIVNASPNPASVYTTFNYFLPGSLEDVELIILDITGKQITSFKLPYNKGELTWDTSQVYEGLYNYYIRNGNTKLASGKISVKK